MLEHSAGRSKSLPPGRTLEFALRNDETRSSSAHQTTSDQGGKVSEIAAFYVL